MDGVSDGPKADGDEELAQRQPISYPFDNL